MSQKRAPSKMVKCPTCGKQVRSRGLKGHIAIVHREKILVRIPIVENKKPNSKDNTSKNTSKNNRVKTIPKYKEPIELKRTNRIKQVCKFCSAGSSGCDRFINLAGDEICHCIICRNSWYPEEKKFTPEEVEKYRLKLSS